MTGDGGWFTEGFDTLELKEAEALLTSGTPNDQFRNGHCDWFEIAQVSAKGRNGNCSRAAA